MLSFKQTYSQTDFDHHIKCILKSGLILDEDMEFILTYYSADEESDLKNNFSLLEALTFGFSLASAIFIIQKEQPIFYLPIAASPILIICGQRLYKVYKRNKRKHCTETLIKNLCNIFKVNKSIREYLKNRSISNASDNIVNPFNPMIQQLMDVIFSQETQLLTDLRSGIDFCGNFVSAFKTDYTYLEDIDYGQFDIKNLESINDCISYLEKLSDIILLIVSNCLTCFAFMLYADVKTDELLDSIMPKIKAKSQTCYNSVNKKFNEVRYFYINKSEIKKIAKPQTLNSSSKLHISTCDVLINTSEILEKSQIILKKLGENDLTSKKQTEEMYVCVDELRNHVYSYYESLNILSKLYQISLNRKQTSCEQKIVQKTHSDLPSEGQIYDASLNATEPLEDEEYELYIGDESNVEVGTHYDFDEDEAYKYLSLLSRELKYKLKEHSRFVAARKKRGITDEDLENVQQKQNEVETQEEKENILLKSDVKILSNLPVPPPPPPPLTKFTINETFPEPSQVTGKDLLQSLKSVSIKCNEEVFQAGDTDESEDD